VPASRCTIWGQKKAGGALRLKGSNGGLIPPENPFPGARFVFTKPRALKAESSGRWKTYEIMNVNVGKGEN